MADIKWVATALTSLVVAVIVIALVAVPVVEDIQGGIRGGSNASPIHRFADYTGEEVELTWHNGASQLGDGTVVPSTSIPVNAETLSPNFISDKVLFRGGTSGYYLYLIDEDVMYRVVSKTPTVVIDVAANGNYTVTVNNNQLATGTLTNVLIASPTGEIGQYSTPIKAAVDQAVYLANWHEDYGPYYLKKAINGSVSSTMIDPFNLGTASGVQYPIVQADPITQTIEYAVSEGFGQYSGVETTYGVDSTTDHCFIYAPIVYGEEGSEQSGINSTLIGIIPMLLFIVAVMVAVRIIRM